MLWVLLHLVLQELPQNVDQVPHNLDVDELGELRDAQENRLEQRRSALLLKLLFACLISAAFLVALVLLKNSEVDSQDLLNDLVIVLTSLVQINSESISLLDLVQHLLLDFFVSPESSFLAELAHLLMQLLRPLSGI